MISKNQRRKKCNKKAQVQVAFNWIYILIAGGLILLFFIGLVVKQKTISEQRINTEVVRVMESIFTAAGVAEKTKNVIDSSGLADFTLSFSCSEGVGEFGMEGSSSMAENSVEPIFSPREIKSSKLLVWSLPYKLPFKVIDFLFVSSANTKYFLVGDRAAAIDMMNESDGFNVNYVENIQEGSFESGKMFQVRVIDLSGLIVQRGAPVPESFHSFPYDKVTAVSFTEAEGLQMAAYYRMGRDRKWEKVGRPVELISLPDERDAVVYAAIFAEDDKIFRCNMEKVFKRLRHVGEVYTEKLQEMEEYYETTHPGLAFASFCLNNIKNNEKRMDSSLTMHRLNIDSCLLGLRQPESTLHLCNGLIGTAADIRWVNEQLEMGCVTLY